MTIDDPARFGCRLPGCGGPRSGVCINNLPFDECPDVLEAEAEDDGNAGEDGAERRDGGRDATPLPGGRALDTAGCDALLRSSGGTVVSIVAPPDVGKTTMVATIYELLHRRRLPGFGFAGSETIQAYEERCHLARLASNAAAANTQRTPVSAGLRFTHLRVAIAEGIRDVLFADRSGEHFEEALARPASIDDFAELHRADATVMLVDLVRLVEHPHTVVSSLRRLFMAIDQRGLLQGRRVLLAGTKADLALPTTRSRKATRALAEVAEELERRAGGRFAISTHLVACRPRPGSAAVGEGLDRLLAAMLEPNAPVTQPPGDVWPAQPSELDRLMLGYRRRP